MAGDIKLKYGTVTALTVTLGGLGSSSTKVAGRASAAEDNTTNLYLDALISGWIKAGTSPTAATADVWVWGQEDDTPTYPDTITGLDAAITLTSVDIRNAGLAFGATVITSGTTGSVYYFKPFSVANLFGGVMPKKWGIFVTHAMVAALDATNGNHKFVYTPVLSQYT